MTGKKIINSELDDFFLGCRVFEIRGQTYVNGVCIKEQNSREISNLNIHSIHWLHNEYCKSYILNAKLKFKFKIVERTIKKIEKEVINNKIIEDFYISKNYNGQETYGTEKYNKNELVKYFFFDKNIADKLIERLNKENVYIYFTESNGVFLDFMITNLPLEHTWGYSFLGKYENLTEASIVIEKETQNILKSLINCCSYIKSNCKGDV